MHRFLLSLFSVWLIFCAAAAGAVTIDFDSLPSGTSPLGSLPGISVSGDGLVLDETTLVAVTGIPFPAGSVATSGANVLTNALGAVLTISFATPVTSVSVETVGALAGSTFGTITMEAFNGALSLGSATSNPAAIGDSGAPEATLSLAPPGSMTSVVFSADLSGPATFALDDLVFTPVPEPGTALLVVAGAAVLGLRGCGERRR